MKLGRLLGVEPVEAYNVLSHAVASYKWRLDTDPDSAERHSLLVDMEQVLPEIVESLAYQNGIVLADGI